ncbi:5922_t:CDS:2 [Scutellospora calospora]|uniref:5922_t:CDS:1 n=1 Tax=Scutellospora calospora TaxID=85575 RepID=A0ACA9KWI6_9GLOM|nr:5922_t:CDS:2 [Scutellospora calospora]
MIESAKYPMLASIIPIYNYLINELTKYHNNPNYSHEIITAVNAELIKKKQRINQQNEVELYLEAPQAMRKQDILQYIPVERVFSEGTDLISVKRCGLSADSIRACMCLKSWWT